MSRFQPVSRNHICIPLFSSRPLRVARRGSIQKNLCLAKPTLSHFSTVMAQALPLLLLLFTYYCAGALAQGALTQPPSISASPGEAARISCTRNSGNITSDYVSWYQQKPGTVPKLMIYAYTKRPTGIPDRFSGSTDSSANSATLTISNVQAEDEAGYYCFSYVGNNQFVFGGGTQLTVTGQQSAPPTVLLFPPSHEEIETRSKATLVCLMTEFRPGAVQVDWMADGNVITEGVETARPTKQNDKYVASSYLTVSGSDWKSREAYTCKVTHQGQVIEKSVKSSECP